MTAGGTLMTNLWQGEKVRLRAIEPEDWEAFRAFDADTEMARLGWRVGFPHSVAESQQWAAEQSAAGMKDDRRRLAIETLAGTLVGSANVHCADARNGVFEYGIALGAAYRRRGYASEAIRLLLAYYFRELRYQKALVTVYAFNEPSIRLHEKLGFQLEGRLRRMVFSGGALHDELVFGMTAEEFAARAA